MSYLIRSTERPDVTSRNSRELKRRIKSSKPAYKKYSAGIYDYVDKEGKICFKVEYTLDTQNNNSIRVKGRQFNLVVKESQKK